MALDKNIKEELKKILKTKINEERQKTIIKSVYKLNQEEIDKILTIFPFLKKSTIKNRLDPEIGAGVVIKFGSKIIDLSLSSHLKNFQKIMFDIR